MADSNSYVNIGRVPEGITLNGTEWLYDDNTGGVMRFPDKQAAIAFLREAGAEGTDEDIEAGFIIETFWYCVQCGEDIESGGDGALNLCAAC